MLSCKDVVFALAALACTALAGPLLQERRNATTREFNFRLSWQQYAPAGVSRNMILVNGQSPGPVMELEQDDWVVVNLINDTPFNTSIHFHGIEMHQTPWADGVPGVTQHPIHQGRTFTHQFRATQYGSFWYHSHLQGQIEDGCYGAITIRQRPGEPKPFHLISSDAASQRAMEAAEAKAYPLLISDLTRLESTTKWKMSEEAGIEVSCYDALLFNGKGRVRCLPPDEMAAKMSPTTQRDLALTTRCLPPKVMAAFGGDANALKANKVIPGVFEGCEETEGAEEVIHATYRGNDTNSWIAIEVIGAVNFATPVVSIDGHDMWVYSMDGAYIEPQKVQIINMANGERYGILVKLRGTGRFQIRANSNTAAQMIIGNAVLSVDDGQDGHDEEQAQKQNKSATTTTTTTTTATKPYIDIVGNPTSKDLVVFDQAIAHPFPPAPVGQRADATFVLNMRLDGASYLWALNSTRLQPMAFFDARPPVLYNPKPWERDNVTITTRNGTWVDLVFLASVFPMPPHPIHKHGNKMFQIGAGQGPFRWASVEEALRDIPGSFNLRNPPQRDGFLSLQASKEVNWVVVRYEVVNPGAWLLHCHINNHMMGGMMMVIQDGVDAWPVKVNEHAHGTYR
ncbi:multicopper oxidase [Purpureocillium lavendulum]|uniref:Multicopper oxidase n=1 Tax=Purpureocillium lavendulum TaxID=1247861 RepID=A0AB34FDX3_9HYPO|nr:multicopper oxidase [Purpureocillium lavendulum]